MEEEAVPQTSQMESWNVPDVNIRLGCKVSHDSEHISKGASWISIRYVDWGGEKDRNAMKEWFLEQGDSRHFLFQLDG